jgi:tagatose 6-phosphate kinase
MVFRPLVLDAVNRAVTALDGVSGKSINVAKVLCALGEQPLTTGFLGGDRGEQLRAALTTRGIAHDFVTVSPPTRQCVTVIDQSAGTHTELVEESRPVQPADFERLEATVRRCLCGCRALVMSGTIVPGGPADLYRQCTCLAHASGVMAAVDAHGSALVEALKAGPELVKPNRTELAGTLGRELPDDATVMSAMRDLSERGAQRIIVTAGSKPTLAFDGRLFWKITSPRIPVVNPIGSGDAFTAAVVSRLVRGDNLGEACRWGSAAGAANALTAMPGELDRDEVRRWARQVEVERL